MDYYKLIERLRNAAGGPEGIQMCQDAATAIEALQAESIMHHNAADNYFAEANEYREERNDALTELEQMAACIYYKPGGLRRYGGDDPANMCVLGPCPNNKSVEKVLADVAPVRHGRWIDSSNGWMCSECKQDNTYDKPWCPNCGAKMDAKEDEDAEPAVHCIDCIYLMFSDFYGECKRGYLSGIVRPGDYCSRGIRKEDNT